MQTIGRARTPEEIGDSVVAMRGIPIGADSRCRGSVREGGGPQARRGLAERQAGRHRRRAEAAGREHDRADRPPGFASLTRFNASCPRA